MDISGISSTYTRDVKQTAPKDTRKDVSPFKQLMSQRRTADNVTLTSQPNQRQGDELHELTEQEIHYLSKKYDVSDMSYEEQDALMEELYRLGAISKEDYNEANIVTLPKDGWEHVNNNTYIFTVFDLPQSSPYSERNFLENTLHLQKSQSMIAKGLQNAGYAFDYMQENANKFGRLASVLEKLKK